MHATTQTPPSILINTQSESIDMNFLPAGAEDFGAANHWQTGVNASSSSASTATTATSSSNTANAAAAAATMNQNVNLAHAPLPVRPGCLPLSDFARDKLHIAGMIVMVWLSYNSIVSASTMEETSVRNLLPRVAYSLSAAMGLGIVLLQLIDRMKRN